MIRQICLVGRPMIMSSSVDAGTVSGLGDGSGEWKV